MSKKAIVFMLFAVFVSCGGGSGGSNNNNGSPNADAVTITVDSGAPTTYTETANASSPVSFDPYIWSSSSGTASAHMYIHAFNGAFNSTPRMEISIKGTVPGTYHVSDGNAMYYMPAGGPTYACTVYLPVTSGTITIMEFGASGGGQIRGTFDVISTVGTTTHTAHLTGSFTITRD